MNDLAGPIPARRGLAALALAALASACDAGRCELPAAADAPSAPAVAPAPHGGELVGSPALVRLGDAVDEGARARFEHRVVNGRPGPARLATVTASCGCTAVDLAIVGPDGAARPAGPGAVLAPGESLEVVRVVDTAGRPGPSSTVVDVVFADPPRRLGFTAEFVVRPAVTVLGGGGPDGRSIDLGAAFAGRAVPFDVVVGAERATSLSLAQQSDSMGAVTVTRLDDTRWRVVGAWRPRGLDGAAAATLALTAHADGRTPFAGERTSLDVDLRLRAEVRPALSVRRPYLSLGSVGPGATVAHEVALERHDPGLEPSDLAALVDGAGDEARARVAGAADGGTTLSFTLRAPTAPGRFEGEVRIDAPDGARLLTLPYFGAVAPEPVAAAQVGRATSPGGHTTQP